MSHNASPSVIALAAQYGFSPQHVGGNCWQLLREERDYLGTLVTVVTAGCEPVIDDDPDAARWCVSQFLIDRDGVYMGDTDMVVDLTLSDALAHFQ